MGGSETKASLRPGMSFLVSFSRDLFPFLVLTIPRTAGHGSTGWSDRLREGGSSRRKTGRSDPLLSLLAWRFARQIKRSLLSLECNGLIEDLEALKECHRFLREKVQKLKGKKSTLKRELAGVKEELSWVSSECR